MFWKQKAQSVPEEAPLWLSVGADDLCGFAGPAVRSLRHMLTGLVCRGMLPPRLSLVAAARAEGGSYATLALGALAAADLSRRTCVVELNWRWPVLPGLLGQAAGPGLAAWLAGRAELDDVLVPASPSGLWLLPAGALPAVEQAAAARSDRLRALAAQLSERFEHVFFDVPAVLATSDAIPLASLGDACCLVVRQGATPAGSLRRTLADVSHLKVLGVIMNRVRMAMPLGLLRLVQQG